MSLSVELISALTNANIFPRMERYATLFLFSIATSKDFIHASAEFVMYMDLSSDSMSLTDFPWALFFSLEFSLLTFCDLVELLRSSFSSVGRLMGRFETPLSFV